MELDEFKQRFKETGQADTAFRSAGELEGYTRKRTGSILSNVKRSILFELVACFLFVAVAVWAWFAYPVSYIRAFSLLSVCFCCLLLIYLAALYKKISVYEKAPLAVKNNLQQVIDILGQFTRAYFQFTMITLPIAFVFGLITGFLNVYDKTGAGKFDWNKAMLFYTAWFVFWSVMMYFFSKWYIKKLYGNYLQQLKEQLKDIENG